jgi:cation diffusion facilitator CzcD-associated flavoprotein CzcO
MKVAVIGGGPSGLVTLKYLIRAHLNLDCDPIEARLFELEDSIGGAFAHRTYEDAEVSTCYTFMPGMYEQIDNDGGLSSYPRNNSQHFRISAVAPIKTFSVRVTTYNTCTTTAQTFVYGLALSWEPRFATYKATLLRATWLSMLRRAAKS